jgi:16S rRNA (uracil1498-N3)-methyltransferase
MHRFHLPPGQCRGDSIRLEGGEAHHATRVLRLKPGDIVTVLDGAGARLICSLGHADHKGVSLSVVERSSEPPLPCSVTLAQALPKASLIESIVQKATELGVARIVPLITERVVAQPGPDRWLRKSAKWRSIAVEAIKQCGTAWLPKIESPLTLREFLARKEAFELPLFASLQPPSRHLREYVLAFRNTRRRNPLSACVFVGPEGDFTDAETTAMRAAGFLPITLGPLVLRVETAAICCLSILNYELATP